MGPRRFQVAWAYTLIAIVYGWILIEAIGRAIDHMPL